MAFSLGTAFGEFAGGLFQGASSAQQLMSNYYDLQRKADDLAYEREAIAKRRASGAAQADKEGANKLPSVPSSVPNLEPATAVSPLNPATGGALNPNAPTLYAPGQAPAGSPQEPLPAPKPEPAVEVQGPPAPNPVLPTYAPAKDPEYTAADPGTRMAAARPQGQGDRYAVPPFGGGSGAVASNDPRDPRGRYGGSALATDTPLVYLPPGQFTAQTQQQAQTQQAARPQRSPVVALAGAGGYVPYVG